MELGTSSRESDVLVSRLGGPPRGSPPRTLADRLLVDFGLDELRLGRRDKATQCLPTPRPRRGSPPEAANGKRSLIFWDI